MNESVEAMRRKIAVIGKLIFDRKLTDAAGGNISARVAGAADGGGDLICITPRYSGSKHQWNLRSEQVLVSDLQGNHLDGDGQISREAKVHFGIYRAYPDVGAVIHCHAQNALVFACTCTPIEPVLEDTLKFGTIQVTRFGPAHSDELAEGIIDLLKGQEPRIRKQAAGVLGPWHGLFVAGKDLDAAFDAAERIDTNARVILMSRLLPGSEAYSPEAIRACLERAIQEYE